MPDNRIGPFTRKIDILKPRVTTRFSRAVLSVATGTQWGEISQSSMVYYEFLPSPSAESDRGSDPVDGALWLLARDQISRYV